MSKPRTDRACRRRAGGFTLVEALASLLLVAIVLPFVIRGMALSAKAGGQADREATAIMLAQAAMDEVILGRSWVYGGTRGDFEERFGREAQRYRWELSVADWQIPDYRELTVTVSWQQGNGPKQVDLTTVIYTGGGLLN